MLRKFINSFVKKDLPVPLLCESEVREVKVDVKDPISGDIIDTRIEHCSTVRRLSEESAVSDEPADIYSIENLQRVGITPVMCPRSAFVNNPLDNATDVESVSALLLDRTEKPVETPVVETPVTEPSKTE